MYKYSEKGKTWVNRDTGEEYELFHLEEFQTSFEVKLGEKMENVDVRVIFKGHCYTEKQEEGGKEEVVYTEKKKNGPVERVFCPKRWEFSKRLPDIIRGLNYKTCLPGERKELIFRQEDRSNPTAHDGWYIFMKLEYKPKENPSVELWVESAYHRSNRPDKLRGGPTQFFKLLKDYLKPRYSKPE